MSEEKEKEFRSDRFTWESGQLQKEDGLPDDLANKFSTYYEIKAQLEAQKEEKKNEPK